jgi:inorganic pyrophosphatase
MKVFIENEAGSNIKNLFNEETLEFRKSVQVSADYPFPYGFLLDTQSGDGDNLDCFVLTKQLLKSREIVEVEPLGMFEEIEDGEEDHKILAVLPGETWEIDENLEQTFRDFSAKVFSHLPGKVKTLGRFLGKEDALRLIESAKK